jgi:hypothetical protein
MRALLVVGVGMLAACQEPSIGVRLRFPSEQTFLITNTVTIDVYDGEGTGAQSPDAICRALSVESAVAPAGLQPLKSSRNTNACQFIDGGVSFDGVETGRRVFFAEAISFDASAILRGCTVADLSTTPGPDDPAAAELGVQSLVDIQLATLPTYPDNVQPACEDVVQKCAENKPCVDNN